MENVWHGFLYGHPYEYDGQLLLSVETDVQSCIQTKLTIYLQHQNSQMDNFK